MASSSEKKHVTSSSLCASLRITAYTVAYLSFLPGIGTLPKLQFFSTTTLIITNY